MGLDDDGSVHDEPRRAYLEDHIGKVADALDAGIPMMGYFAWSLMDNFEWAEGYQMRFGIVHVDYDTQIRTVKDSGKWYAGLCAGDDLGTAID
jgi:beta-glucosidase